MASRVLPQPAGPHTSVGRPSGSPPRGGLPLGRPTLVCGPAGCGKTLLAMEFLFRGITEFGDPASSSRSRSRSTSWSRTSPRWASTCSSCRTKAAGDGPREHLARRPRGDRGLGPEGLFIRLGAAIDEVGAKRVVLDTIETLFGAFQNSAMLRSELRRLFSWLKLRGVTAVVTGERGDGLDPLRHRGVRLRLRDRAGPPGQRADLHPTAAGAEVPRLAARHQRVSVPDRQQGRVGAADHLARPAARRVHRTRLHGSREPRRDAGRWGALPRQLGADQRHRRHRQVDIAAQFCAAACTRGERALYFAFEESEAQIIRNMASVGIDLARWVDDGLLQFRCIRPSLLGLEAHLILDAGAGRRLRARTWW